MVKTKERLVTKKKKINIKSKQFEANTALNFSGLRIAEAFQVDS